MRSIASVAVALMLTASGAAETGKTLDIYAIDTEGGQATLFVTPAGQSVLIDTGNPGGRDSDRIIAALEGAGIKQIDYLLLSHYHIDHIGSVLELAKRVPIRHFVDHGPNVEPKEQLAGFQQAYSELYARSGHTVVKPGDTLPVSGVEWKIVSAAGQVLKTPLAGAGKPNPACDGVARHNEPGPSENAQSVGSVITYGRFRVVDLADLLWDNELDLMCPVNRIGTADLYITSHHGLAQSGSPALVHAVHPRVAIMNNGTRKGGAVQAFEILHSSPGLEDLWQLHWSYNGGLEQNSAGVFIANVDEPATVAGVLTQTAPGAGAPRPAPHSGPANLIKVSARQDGTFTVTNTRNGFSKTYARKPES
jgi:beta-lactamase superfamily II metal-dependent hydrolase